MISTRTALNTLIAGAFAVGLAAAAHPANAETEQEKCYGVVKAGHNDCANPAKTHSCAGAATADSSNEEWIVLPKGVCEKLVGGSLTPGEAAKKDESHSG